MKNLGFSIFFVLCLGIASSSFAKGGGGGHSLGLGVGLATSNQTDLDALATAVNASGGGRNAATMSSGLEFGLYYQYRFSGTMFAMQFRPTYVTQSGKGSTDSTTMTGYSFFPMLKLYPLENSFIHFYMQAGLGYGSLSGKIQQPGVDISFSGSAFGAVGGLGAEFCFTDSHCAFVEGNYRYLPIERNVVSASNAASSGTITQSGAGNELEMNGYDLRTSMSGIIGSIGYQMNF
jgi:hypothetical protein